MPQKENIMFKEITVEIAREHWKKHHSNGINNEPIKLEFEWPTNCWICEGPTCMIGSHEDKAKKTRRRNYRCGKCKQAYYSIEYYPKTVTSITIEDSSGFLETIINGIKDSITRYIRDDDDVNRFRDYVRSCGDEFDEELLKSFDFQNSDMLSKLRGYMRGDLPYVVSDYVRDGFPELEGYEKEDRFEYFVERICELIYMALPSIKNKRS